MVVQSFYVEHGRVLVEVENCQPFGGCTKEVRVDSEATARLEKEQPLGQFNGLGGIARVHGDEFADLAETERDGAVEPAQDVQCLDRLEGDATCDQQRCAAPEYIDGIGQRGGNVQLPALRRVGHLRRAVAPAAFTWHHG